MNGLRLALVVALAGCGGRTTDAPLDDASVDARAETSVVDSAQSDSARPDTLIACVDESGGMPTSIKACTNTSDCAMRSRRSDCCGSEMIVGVRADLADAFATCEAERQKGLPVCDCLAQPTRAEDGREVSGFTTKVRCTDFTGSGGICKTYVE